MFILEQEDKCTGQLMALDVALQQGENFSVLVVVNSLRLLGNKG